MDIVLGQLDDLDEIENMIGLCINRLRKNGIYQWNENYPSREIIRNDIINKNLYKIRYNNSCIGIVVIDEISEKEWGTVKWSETNIKPLMVHRLVVDPSWQRMGIGKRLINFTMDYARDNKYDSIRFDVYSGNPEAVKTYERLGCVKRGEVYFPYRTLPFYCFEKNV